MNRPWTLIRPGMMRAFYGTIRLLAVATIAAGMACGERAATALPTAPVIPPPPPAPSLPFVAEAATTYYHVGNPGVRYVFPDVPGDEFRLEYGSAPWIVGDLTRTDSTLILNLWSGGPPSWCNQAWCEAFLATATAKGDTLFVQYDAGSRWLLCNDMMDSEACNGGYSVFVRAR